MKSQGLKKGERVEKIGGPISVVKVRRERLFVRGLTSDRRYGPMEAAREGFPHLASYGEFVDLFIAYNGGSLNQVVTRIEFEYVETA